MPARSIKSPFPGMDPYLERHWPDVHQRLCAYACDIIQSQLGSDLVARLGERLVVETDEEIRRSIYPDVRIIEHGLAGVEISPESLTGVAVAEPMVLEIVHEPMPQGFVEIIEPVSGKLVTVIEFLSPSNKLKGLGRSSFEMKQQELYWAFVNLVNIDLVRTGEHCFVFPSAAIPDDKSVTYVITVNRGHQRHSFELYPISIRKPLPAIRIPLRQNEKDIVLNIQTLIDQAYANGRYDRTDYTRPCVPPLEGDDSVWTRELIAVPAK